MDAGVDCDTPTPDCAVPTDVQIELRFDRFLLPGNGLGAGLTLYSGDPKANAVSLTAKYDLIERVVVVHPSAALQPNTLYTAEIVPSTDPNRGFWAFDRAPLEPGDVPLTFSFTTGNGPATPKPPAAVTTDNCTTLAKAGAQAGTVTLPSGPLNVCVGCHQNPPAVPPTDPGDFVAAYPPMGLALTDWGLAHTAINHVAHEAETGNSALGPGLENAPRFGVQMNLIAPGSPENSYLMYKLLRKPENFALRSREACPTAYHSPVQDTACTPPADDELTLLREWFVRGDPMPKDAVGAEPGSASISRDELVRVANWISAGAVCDVP